MWAGVQAWGISKNDGFDTTRLGNRYIYRRAAARIARFSHYLIQKGQPVSVLL
jgi:hypothetical protein